MKSKIQKTKEEILEALENKSIKKLAEEYVEAENKLLRGLAKLKNFGEECDCNQRKVIEVIADEGEFPEISAYCLNCGGYVNGA